MTKRSELARISMRFVQQISALVFKRKIVFHLIRKLTPALDPKDKVKVEKTLERGYVRPHPVAVVFIVSDRRIALSMESAQYALYNPKFPNFLGIMMPANTEFDQIYSAYIDIIYT